MSKFFRIAEPIYLLLLGVGIGAIIACGAFAAPVVFHMKDFIEGTTQFDSGIVMGKIFMRLNAYLRILFIVICIYEILSFLFLRRVGVYSIFWLILAIINATCIALFVWYYSPFLNDINSLADSDFTKIHSQSVLIFKILMASLSITFIWRVYNMMKGSNT